MFLLTCFSPAYAPRLGNEAFAVKNYDAAIKHYSDAIEVEPSNAIFYSNRSACYAAKKDWQEAAKDAQTCVEKDPSFLKGFFRLSTAQVFF